MTTLHIVINAIHGYIIICNILTDMMTLGFFSNITVRYLFGTLNNETFNQYINNSNIQNRDNDKDNSSYLILKLLSNLTSIFNQFKVLCYLQNEKV